MRDSYYCDKCFIEREVRYFTKYIQDTSKARTCDCCQDQITERVIKLNERPVEKKKQQKITPELIEKRKKHQDYLDKKFIEDECGL